MHTVRYSTCARDYQLLSPRPLVAGNDADEQLAYSLFMALGIGDGREEQCEGGIVPDDCDFEPDYVQILGGDNDDDGRCPVCGDIYENCPAWRERNGLPPLYMW